MQLAQARRFLDEADKSARHRPAEALDHARRADDGAQKARRLAEDDVLPNGPVPCDADGDPLSGSPGAGVR
jgi:hypothetical protein